MMTEIFDNNNEDDFLAELEELNFDEVFGIAPKKSLDI